MGSSVRESWCQSSPRAGIRAGRPRPSFARTERTGDGTEGNACDERTPRVRLRESALNTGSVEECGVWSHYTFLQGATATAPAMGSPRNLML